MTQAKPAAPTDESNIDIQAERKRSGPSSVSKIKWSSAKRRTLAPLGAFVFIIMGANSPLAQEYITLADKQFYTTGPFGAFMNPFNASGRIFTEGLTLQPSTFPNNTKIVWSWPSRPCNSICGFLQLSYGDYNGTSPQTGITPKQLNNITTLTSTHDVKYLGPANGFDAIYDMFLTSAPNTTHLFEVEIFLHTPSYSASLVSRATRIGSFAGSGITWTVAVSPGVVPDILFVPADLADVPAASIDMRAMFSYLIAQGRITGTEWYNGHALGIEPRQSSGSMIVSSFSVAYE